MINHRTNKGFGKALETGFKYVINNANDKDFIVTMDTDNSHTVALSYSLVNKLENENKDVAIASRYVRNSKIKGLQTSENS